MVLNEELPEKKLVKKKWLLWCQEKQRWSVENNWRKIIFSDESKMMIGHDEREYVWRKGGKVGGQILSHKNRSRSSKSWYGGAFLGSNLAQLHRRKEILMQINTKIF